MPSVTLNTRAPQSLVDAAKSRCPYPDPSPTTLVRWALAYAAGLPADEYAGHRPPGGRRRADLAAGAELAELLSAA